MSSEKTPKKVFTPVMTPKGTFVFPKLNKPDAYKDGDPKWSVKLRLSVEDSAALIEKIEAALADYWPIAQAEQQAKIDAAKTGPEKAKQKKILQDMAEADKSYKPVYDDDGEETGEYEFNFKMPTEFKSKKDGKVIKIKPDIFDAGNKLLKNPPEIWGGTTGHVAGELRPFFTNVGVGISLRLKAVQLIELVSSGGGEKSASSYGFGAQEGGYTGDDSEPEGADTPAEEDGHTPEDTDEF